MICEYILAFLLFYTTLSVGSQLSCSGSCQKEDNPSNKDEEVDFIPSGKVKLDLMADFENNTHSISVEVVRQFIRSVRNVPEQKDTDLLVSGSQTGEKPAWCFYPFQLKKLVKVELNIYKMLKKYYDENEDNELSTPILDSYLWDIEESSMKAKLNAERSAQDPYLYIASHPILIYRLIRRFAEDLQPILREIDSVDKEFVKELSKIANPNSLVFPTKADLDDALEVISRTQHGNTLDTYKMARGILGTLDTGIHLNAFHCLEIGAFYLNSKDFDYAIQWFHVALEKALKSRIVQSYPKIEKFFKRAFEKAVDEHNMNFGTLFEYRWHPGVFNSKVSLPFMPSSYVRRIEQLNPEASMERHDQKWNWAIQSNFRRVCSGENLLSEEEKASLKCWYIRDQNPYWLINPLKTELLSLDPPVYQIYEFLGEKLMNRIKNVTFLTLSRSQVVDIKTAYNSKIDSTRTSSQTWLDEDYSSGKFLGPLTKKLELMSGLVISPPNASDPYQIAAYGPSHHYEAHIDSFEDKFRIIPKGNRITTIMGYLNDVEVGGKTGFPVLGIAADPIKGSIVMWDNLKQNGYDRDLRTWHGGCPVVLGVKWITNKWVYYNENMFTFKCALDKDE